MIIRQRAATTVAALALVVLAGCSKAPEQPAPPAPTPQMTKELPPATSREQMAYYSQHLDEARETWHQCQQAHSSDITDEIRARCAAAQSAWETQPYKPKDRK